MLSVSKDSSAIVEVKKSKFYSFCFFVDGVDEVDRILGELKDKYSDSTHICYAYVLASPSRERVSDDGEPEGTAGKPIMEVIKRRKLSNVLVAVVRYFGGTKLGAGGLVRAYTNASVEVLDSAGVAEYCEAYFYSEYVKIADIKVYLNMLKQHNAVVQSVVYGQDVHVEYYCFDNINNNYKYKKLVVKES